MTRTEFFADVGTFADLKTFCNDRGISICDSIYSREEAYMAIRGIIRDRIMDDDGWEWVKYFLRDIPEDCNYYIEDDCGGFDDAEGCFEEYWGYVLNYMDSNDMWDEEEEELEDEDGDWFAEDWYVEDAFTTEEGPEEISENDFLTIIGKAG